MAGYRRSRAHRRRRTAREPVLSQWNLADSTHQTSQRLHDTGTPEHRVKIVDRQSGDLVWKRFAEVGRATPSRSRWAASPAVRRSSILPPLGDGIGPPISRRRRLNLTADLAEFAGYFMGAGTLHAKGLRLRVADEDADVRDRLIALARQLFNIEATVSQKGAYAEIGIHSVPLAMCGKLAGSESITRPVTRAAELPRPRSRCGTRLERSR